MSAAKRSIARRIASVVNRLAERVGFGTSPRLSAQQVIDNTFPTTPKSPWLLGLLVRCCPMAAPLACEILPAFTSRTIG